jgi:glycosyltransferase involved in cell wall biosynthesis
MVGTIEPRKGHDQVIKACELLWMTGMKLNLVIVGKKGWMVEELISRLEKHKQLNRRLYWYQGISDEALNQLYEIADGMVMASEGEGFGLPLIEAAQHNCPVLARDLPVFREVAGQHAAWFNGNSPLKLAYALKSWIDALSNGSAPLSTGMPWTTWKESSARIVGLLTDSQDANWVYHWKPDPANKQKNETARGTKAIKSPKCIAVDLTLVLPGGDNGGAKVFLLELLRLLAEMKPDTQFIMLTRESSHKELAFLDRPNLRRIMILPDRAGENSPKTTLDRFIVWMKRTGKRWKKSIRKRLKSRNTTIERRLSDMGVDLFYSPFASLQNAETGIPAVCTIHDLQYKSYPEFFDPEELAKRDWLFMDACHRATIMAAISDYSRKSAITHGMLAPERIRTIHHQIARRFSSCNGEEITLLARLGLEKTSYFLYPANFWLHKNHELLLTAFDMAAREELKPEIKLVCTGAPTQRQKELIENTQLMGLGDRVIFTGYVTNDELSSLLSNSTALIFPSLYEGFGLPVIEAMAAGVPVACSNTSALPEITAGAALLFDPDSPEQIAWAMITLSNDASMRDRLVQTGLKQASLFSDQNQMAMEYWELFETALNSDFNCGASQVR